MPLTREFKATVQNRVRQDAEFRKALLVEALDALLIDGDLDLGKTLLRDYINATVGFGELAKATDTSPQSLMRMFSHAGNPRADNLLRVIRQLQATSDVQLRISAA